MGKIKASWRLQPAVTESLIAKGVMALAMVCVTTPLLAQDIVHDAEHYVLLKQYKGQWAEQDEALQEKLDALREKHGTPPNIIHIMWDDTPVGEVGIPIYRRTGDSKRRT